MTSKALSEPDVLVGCSGRGRVQIAPAALGRKRERSRTAFFTKAAAVSIVAFAGGSAALEDGIVRWSLKILGAMLVVGAAALLRRGERMAAEVKLYFAFVVWGMVSGFAVADDPWLAASASWSMFQMGLLFWGVVVAHSRFPDLRVVMWGLWGFGVLFAILTFTNPDAVAVLQGQGPRTSRMTVTGENPNLTGQIFVFAVFAALFIAERTDAWRARILVLAGVPLFVFLLLYTGSRKMLIAAIVIGVLWLSTGGRARSASKTGWLGKGAIVASIAVAAYFAVSSWEDTPVARRSDMEVQGNYRGGIEDRRRLAIGGLRLFLENPVAGVGLGNQVHVLGTVAHVEFVDVLAATGAVGAVLYFSIYFVAGRRVVRARHGALGRQAIEVQAAKTYGVLLLWLMFGFSRYNDFFNLLVLGAFIGFFKGHEDRPKGEGDPRSVRGSPRRRGQGALPP